jgi:hypothetical protein
MTKEQIRERLILCHQAEDAINKDMGNLNKIIKDAEKKKIKLAKQVSKNMLYRNKLIQKL